MRLRRTPAGFPGLRLWAYTRQADILCNAARADRTSVVAYCAAMYSDHVYRLIWVQCPSSSLAKKILSRLESHA
jgi:hypothetical protein